MDKNLEKPKVELESVTMIERRIPVIERISARAPKQGSSALAFMHTRRRLIVARSIAARLRLSAHVGEAQSSHSPILEVFGFRVGESLLHKDSNPTIFRVSRILLESINRPVNTEKHTWFWRRIDGSQGSDFSRFILFLYFILWRWLASILCVTKPFSRAWLKPWSCLLSNSILAPLR